MKEDRATGMSASHGCTDEMAVVESFKEALKQRVGMDRFRMWFTHGVSFAFDSETTRGEAAIDGEVKSGEAAILKAATELADIPTTLPRRAVVVRVRGAFALDRLKKNYLRELRGAAMAACGASLDVRFVLENEPAVQASLLLDDGTHESDVAANGASSNGTSSSSADAGPGTKGAASQRAGQAASGQAASRRRGSARSIGNLMTEGETSLRAPRRQSPTARADQPAQLALELDINDTPKEGSAKVHNSGMTLAEFIPGSCNQLANAAANMVCQNPGSASPLFLFGSTGVGKTHLLHAIAQQFRRYHRMRTVMVLTAEQFTNDFITSVSATGLPAFRRRYREVDALLVDDVQFLESKRATLREMLFTVETLAAAGRPLIFTANQSPSEIPGLTRELAGRMVSGLVCPMQPLDSSTRKQLLMRLINKSCPLAWPEETVDEINLMLGGDARMSSGVVNLVGMLQRMYQRMPTMSEIREFGGEMLRSQTPTVSLAAIERAVCETFGLQQQSLREAKQTRSITEPRMLAMYLSRQMTSAAFNEISRHYNQKSHTSAILAAKKVEQWIETGKPLGRGPSAMSARQALDRIESILRAS